MSNNPYEAPGTAADAALASTGPGQLASRGKRLLGSIIDGIAAFAVVWGTLYLGFGITFQDFAKFDLVKQTLLGLIAIPGFLLLHGYLLYQYGQTLGKRILGIRIVHINDGTKLPFGPLILKRYAPVWFVSAIPWIGNWLAIIDPLFIFRNDRRCVHDLIADSRVVNC